MEENLLVEKNDVISFIFEKFNCYTKDKLINITRNYYTESTILEAFKCLISAVPVKKSTRRCRRVKHPDPLIAIYDCIQLIPVADQPKFQYCNENNYPKISTNICNNTNKKISSLCKKKPIKHEDDLVCSAENSPEKISFTKSLLIEELAVNRREQNEMKNKVCELSHMVKDLKNEIDNFMKSKELIPIKSEQSLLSKKDDSIILLQNLIDADNLDYDKDEILQSNPELDEDAYSLITDEQDDHHSLKRNFTQFTGNKVKRARPLFKSITSDLMEASNKIIVIKNDEETSDTQVVISSGDFYNPPVESSIEITSTDSFISHIEEVSATNDLIPISDGVNESYTNQQWDDVNFMHIEDSKSGILIRQKNQCSICSQKFNSVADFRLHCRCHMSLSSYDCIICSTKFKQGKALNTHLLECIKKNSDTGAIKKFSCNTCNVFFGDGKALSWHRGLHSQIRRHPCTYCAYKFLSQNALAKHIKNQHNPNNQYSCIYCPEKFSAQTYLTSHIRSHTGEKPYRCKECDHRAATQGLLRKHFETHGEPSSVKCNKCNYVCIGKNKLLKHIQKEHMQPAVCPICSKKFKFPYYLKQHFDNHNKTAYKCPLCFYSTLVKNNYDRHLSAHLSSRTFPCPKCSVPLANKNSLSKHLKSFCKAKV